MTEWDRIGNWLDEPALLLDIGACHGESILCFRALWPRCRIISFEPRKNAWERLCKVALADGNAEVRKYGLGNREGVLFINEYPQHPEGSSLLESTDYHLNTRGWLRTAITYEVEIRRLDEVPLPNLFPMCVKIDAEGYAGQIIEGGRKVMGKASSAIIEVCLNESRYLDGETLERLTPRMEGLGFTYLGMSMLVKIGAHEEWCDSVWRRK